jgi:hypothetical protein
MNEATETRGPRKDTFLLEPYCPFCGGSPDYPPIREGRTVTCGNCDASITLPDYRDIEAVTRAWNMLCHLRKERDALTYRNMPQHDQLAGSGRLAERYR